MAVEITIDARGALDKLAGVLPRVERAIVQGLDEGAALVQNHAKEGHPKVGDGLQGAAAARYRVATKQAGRYTGMLRFLTRTGVLRNSIFIQRARKVSNGWRAAVYSGVRYADRIEYGSVRNPPYPFLRPALESQRKAIAARLAARIKAANR